MRIDLAGTWSIGEPLPPLDGLERALAKAPVERVELDGGALEGWDSSLMVAIEQVLEVCARRGVEVDSERLPEGARRLLGLLAPAPPPRVEPRAAPPHPLFVSLGGRTLAAAGALALQLQFIGEAALSLGRFAAGRARVRAADVVGELEEAGPAALPIVTLIACVTGMILAFVGAATLRRFGAEQFNPAAVGVGVVRELGPMMTAVVMAGRSGSAYAAQLATMQVTGEVDALTTMGISPVDFLVLPRLLALMAMTPLLTVYADFVGIAGGALVATHVSDMSLRQYLHNTRDAISVSVFFAGVIKAAVFGVLVSIAGASEGMRAGRSTAAVGRAATAAVVGSIVWIVVTDGLFAMLLDAMGL
jgi:phospholipid/cholesterol/gamma-HCH transport system permease protein